MQHLLVTSFLPSPPEFILVHTLIPIQPQVINEGLDCALLAENETKHLLSILMDMGLNA